MTVPDVLSRPLPALLATEIAAARIEGILAADPALGRHWRTAMAWSEAAASAGFEDVRLSEAAILMRLTANRAGADPRGAERAGQLLAVMVRPPRLRTDPVAALRRIEAAAAPLGQPADPADRLEDDEIRAIVAGALSLAESPILAGLRAAADYAHRSRRQSPAAERLLFMTAESEARGLTRAEGGGRDAGAGTESPLLRPAEAHWTVTPAAALTTDGFRLWAPIGGIPAFLDATRRQLGRELGHLGSLRHELERLQAVAAAGRGRSRIAELAALIRARPILTSGMVMDSLGVTRKTALSLIAAMEEAGCLVDFTARKAARFWATPTLAARLRHEGRAGAGRRPSAARPEAARPGKGRTRPQEPDAQRLDRLLDDLNQAMKAVEEWDRR